MWPRQPMQLPCVATKNAQWPLVGKWFLIHWGRSMPCHMETGSNSRFTRLQLSWHRKQIHRRDPQPMFTQEELSSFQPDRPAKMYSHTLPQPHLSSPRLCISTKWMVWTQWCNWWMHSWPNRLTLSQTPWEFRSIASRPCTLCPFLRMLSQNWPYQRSFRGLVISPFIQQIGWLWSMSPELPFLLI